MIDFEQKMLAEQDRWIAAFLRVMEKQGEDQATQNRCKQEIEEKWLCRGVWNRVCAGLQLALEDAKGHLTPREGQTAGEEIVAAIQKLSEWNQPVETSLEKRIEQLEKAPNTLQELLGISDVVFEHFYQGGVRYYQSGYFKEAGDIFYCLSVLSPLRFSVWLSLGITEKLLHAHESALRAFSMAAILDPDAVAPHLYSGECYLALHKNDLAEASLKYALECVRDAAEEPAVSHRAQITRLLADIQHKR